MRLLARLSATVLILVLMENCGSEVESELQEMQDQCLNPCSNGKLRIRLEINAL